MKIGLYFGSFNPIHLGHLIVSVLIREAAGLDEIWFVVSPQNPFKNAADLAPENQRLEMVKLALKDEPNLKVTDIEFGLLKPSYTHLTLKVLSKQYPANKFHVIIGEDAAVNFKKWKEAEWIQDNFRILVYNRGEINYELGVGKSKGFSEANRDFFKLPKIDISSTEIRMRIKNNLPIRYFVTENVEQYIRFHKMYSS